MTFRLRHIIEPSKKYKDVRNINIYLMRALFALMFFVLGYDVWSSIFTHMGDWNSNEAVAYSVFAGFSALSLLGMINPVKMIPLLLLEIFYKVLWLILVAYPVAAAGSIEGSPIESRTFAFGLVLLPILILPWRHVFKTYVINLKNA